MGLIDIAVKFLNFSSWEDGTSSAVWIPIRQNGLRPRQTLWWLKNPPTFQIFQQIEHLKFISSWMALQYTFSARLYHIDTVSGDNMTCRRRIGLTETPPGVWRTCRTCSKGYSHPPREDSWKFCCDRMLDENGGHDDEGNWNRYTSHQWPIFSEFSSMSQTAT
jgi:hypothetical protein